MTFGVLLVGLSWMAWVRGCPDDLPDIEWRDGLVVVRNQSDAEWRNVRIWVNDHYAVAVERIPPAGFVRERVNRFVAAYGQTINTSTTPVTSIVVLATTPDGTRVRKAWGTPLAH